MPKIVELRRHTDSDGDGLTADGIRKALAIGAELAGGYDIVVSSGAQRATQTIACFLAAMGPLECGVEVDARWRSEVEDRWKAAYARAGAGDIESFRKADPDLVDKEARLLGDALRNVFDRLPDDGRALVVGHSPMQEVAVYGLTGRTVAPLGKGAGILVVENGGTHQVSETS